MYSISDYASMMTDDARMNAYAAALADVVQPGSVVVDIGTGTGAFALMAAKLGARRVYAIDTNDAVRLGPALARENGVDGCIEFIHEDSRRVTLPERADVVVSDLRGATPFSGGHFEIIADARKRFLAPGGTLLPERDCVYAALVQCPEAYDRYLGPARLAHGVTLEVARDRLRNVPVFERARIGQEHLIVEPARWCELEYTRINAEPASGPVEWIVGREATTHGLVLWFDAVIRGVHGYTTRPGARTAYSMLVLPFERPVKLEPADRVAADIWGSADGDLWAWKVASYAPDGREKSRQKQSSFLGEIARLVPRGMTADLGSDIVATCKETGGS